MYTGRDACVGNAPVNARLLSSCCARRAGMQVARTSTAVPRVITIVFGTISRIDVMAKHLERDTLA